MTKFIEKINELTEAKLVWIEPFGVSVEVGRGEFLRLEFTCDPSEVQTFEFGKYSFLQFPLECHPHVTLQRSQQVVAVDLRPSGSVPANEARNAIPDFHRMIDHLCMLIKTTNEFQRGEDCACALNKIGSVAAIEALFSAYPAVQLCLAELLQPRIIYWLNLCSFETPEKRAAGLKQLEFLRSVIAQTPNIPPASCRRAFYIISKLQERSSETLNLIISVIERIAGTTDHEWKVTRDAAILFVEKRAPHLIRQNVNLWESLQGSEVFDPKWYCNVCQCRFSRPKQLGDICECWAEVGVDDDPSLWRSEK